jgi:hypothetical protein
MLDEHAPFLKGAGVEQRLDPLAGGQLALGVLGGDALLAAARARGRPLLLQPLQDLLQPTKSPSFARRIDGESATKPRRTEAARFGLALA